MSVGLWPAPSPLPLPAARCLLPGLRDFHFSPPFWEHGPRAWMAPLEFGVCRGSAWVRVPGVRTLLSFGSRSLHARSLALPCQLGGMEGGIGGRNGDRSPGLRAEEPCWRLCLWASLTPPRLSFPGWVLGPPVGPRPSLVLSPAWVGALPLGLPFSLGERSQGEG